MFTGSPSSSDWTLSDIIELWTAERQSQKGADALGGAGGIGNGLMQPLLQKTPVEMLAGLLEAEPLTFTLKECSEDTKLEKSPGSSLGEIKTLTIHEDAVA